MKRWGQKIGPLLSVFYPLTMLGLIYVVGRSLFPNLLPYLVLHPEDSTLPVIAIALFMMRNEGKGNAYRWDRKWVGIHVACFVVLCLFWYFAPREGMAPSLASAALYLAYGAHFLSGIYLRRPLTQRPGEKYFFLAMAAIVALPLIRQYFWKSAVGISAWGLHQLLAATHFSADTVNICQGIIFKTSTVTSGVTSASTGLTGMTFAVACLSILFGMEPPTTSRARIGLSYALVALAMWGLNLLRIALVLRAGSYSEWASFALGLPLYGMGFVFLYLFCLKPWVLVWKE